LTRRLASIPRLPDWPERLHELVTANFARPHEFGQWDCLLFPGAVVTALLGDDVADEHVGRYRSFSSAYAYLASLGFTSAEGLIDSLLDEKPIGFAGTGDLVLADDGIPGLCMGDFALSVGEGEAGMVRVPRAQWVKAWAVGDHHSGDMA
jgi:hypothetical protein